MIKLLEGKNRNLSEKLFNELCNNKGIEGEEIPESVEERIKMPDVEIILNNTKIIVEIKRLTGKEDASKKISIAIEKQMEVPKIAITPSGQIIEYYQAIYTASSNIIRNALCKRLKIANKQLGTEKYKKHPGIVVIYNDINFGHFNSSTYPINPSNVDDLMYSMSATSIEPVDKLVTNDKNEIISGLTFEQERGALFKPDGIKCEYINAIGLLSCGNAGPKLQLIHNIFAKTPLDVGLLKLIAYEQYKNTFDVNDNSIPANLIRVDNDI